MPSVRPKTTPILHFPPVQQITFGRSLLMMKQKRNPVITSMSNVLSKLNAGECSYRNALSSFSCVCTESRPESTVGYARGNVPQARRQRRRRPSRRLNHPETSTIASTSTQSDLVTDDDHDMSSVTHDECSKANGPRSPDSLPKPDLIASIPPSTSEMNIPFFGQDDSTMATQCDSMPTSNLEKNLLFHS